VVNTWRKLHEEKYPIDPGYNPLDDERVKGTKYETQHLGKFSRSYSARETEKIIADIERENATRPLSTRAALPGSRPRSWPG